MSHVSPHGFTYSELDSLALLLLSLEPPVLLPWFLFMFQKWSGFLGTKISQLFNFPCWIEPVVEEKWVGVYRCYLRRIGEWRCGRAGSGAAGATAEAWKVNVTSTSELGRTSCTTEASSCPCTDTLAVVGKHLASAFAVEATFIIAEAS